MMRPMAMAWPRPAAARVAFERAVRLGELATEDAATVERGGGQEVDCAEEQVDPDGGAQKVRGRDPGALEEIDLGRDGHDGRAEHEAEADVGDGADDGHALLHRGGRGAFGGLGCGVAQQAAGGEQEDAAQLQAEPGGGDGAGDLAHDDCEQAEVSRAEKPRPPDAPDTDA